MDSKISHMQDENEWDMSGLIYKYHNVWCVMRKGYMTGESQEEKEKLMIKLTSLCEIVIQPIKSKEELEMYLMLYPEKDFKDCLLEYYSFWM